MLAEHEQQMTAPGGDVIERFLPSGQPCLILLDELMNYVTRSRRSGMAAQLYTFVHNLSEVARGRTNTVMAVAIPASELEMNVDDQRDYESLKKLLDRLGKAMMGGPLKWQAIKRLRRDVHEAAHPVIAAQPLPQARGRLPE